MTTIRFADFHRPALPDGVYRLTASVTVEGAAAPYQTSLRFAVGGPVQPLLPADVAAVFPPEGSFGDHADALPHVMLTRAALPWERSGDGADAPWLAVLTLRGDDPVMPLAFAAEVVEPGGPRVETVTLPSAFLARIAPRRSDLALLTHVRETRETARQRGMTLAAHGGAGGAPDPDDDGDADPRAVAVVLGARLPGEGMANTCLLVAVDGRYAPGTEAMAVDAGTTRLVVLKRWSFTCEARGRSFLGMMAQVKARSGPLRLPPVADPGTEAALATGAVALPFAMRQGGRSAGWYRGPLVGSAAPAPLPSPLPDPADAVTSDALLRFDPETGMFDTGLAAAWQIGRLIGLQSRSFARALSVARRGLARQDHTLRREADQAHLALLAAANRAPPPPVPPDFAAMRHRLGRLEGVPFVYLVPDERALPAESLRFFRVDADWVAALIAGAFSLGRTHRADLDREAGLRTAGAGPRAAVCGFLLRSGVVSGWPGLIVEGQPAGGGDAVPPVRMDRLSPTLLLALFDRPVARVDLHLHPESLHHGLTRATGGGYRRSLRAQSGDRMGTEIALDAASPCWRDAAAGLLDPAALVRAMQVALPQWNAALSPPQGAAFLAFQMLEGVDRASFVIPGL